MRQGLGHSAGFGRSVARVARQGCARRDACATVAAAKMKGAAMSRSLVLPLLIAPVLMACSPEDVADKIGRRTAETVVRPIVDNRLTGAQADAATRCVVQNASAAEVQSLARDVGVYAGTSTEATVWAIVARSETQSCLAASGVALGA